MINAVDSYLYSISVNCCLLTVKSGGRRVSKKQENGAVEKNPKNPGKEKTRYFICSYVLIKFDLVLLSLKQLHCRGNGAKVALSTLLTLGCSRGWSGPHCTLDSPGGLSVLQQLPEAAIWTTELYVVALSPECLFHL
uniref:Uncharacterized protein n=1 Tax=Chelydra serpentina TaxID=8475 RepID=A0A8C3S6A0_CHESE